MNTLCKDNQNEVDIAKRALYSGAGRPRLWLMHISARMEYELWPFLNVNPPAMQETWFQSLGWKDPLEKEWHPTSVFLPGKFHGQRNLKGYCSWGLKRVRHDWATNTNKHYLNTGIKYICPMFQKRKIPKAPYPKIACSVYPLRIDISFHVLARVIILFSFNWRIIALQPCGGVSHTSAWISHNYMYTIVRGCSS